MAGYVFCFSKAKWAKWLFWAMMVPIFVSGYVLLISQFVIVGALGFRGWVAVVSMSIFGPTMIYLYRNFFKTIPLSIVESARIDGASEFTVLTRIVLPISKPILGATIVFLGMGSLGAYIWPMLNLQNPRTQTFLVGLMNTAINVQIHVKDIGYDLTIGTLTFIPYMLLFAFSSRYFISGLTGGAIRE
jgi:ABC-type glycerol-3-phosphate transport system permease component